MKKTLLLLGMILGVHLISAQYCGTSDPSQCMSPGLLTSPGFEPYTQITPIINDTVSTTIIEFMSSDTLSFGVDTFIMMDSLHIYGLSNLPSGLCWSTNKPGNTFYGREDGCIKLTGTSCSQPGQYRVEMQFIAYTSIGLPIGNARGGVVLRVVNRGETTPPFDTTGLVGDSLASFIAYGPSAPCFPAGIHELASENITTTAFPNPFTDLTKIVVTGLNEKFGLELYDVTGRLQQSIPSIDNSQFEVQRGLLSRGVYLYRIMVGGKPAAYGKLVVE